MQEHPTGSIGLEAPAYVIRYKQTFDTGLEAGRFFQTGLYRRVYLASGAGLLVGGLLMSQNLSLGLTVLLFSAFMLVTTRFAVMDRLFGRRQFKSVIGRTIVLTLGDDGILWEGPQATSHIPWSSITEVRANPRTVLFVRDKMLLAYAPTASFATPSERAAVIAYSQRQIASAERDSDPPIG